ncbi:MAG: four helix bundle protein [Bacteroidaceae bacterium]|nr:four helix bundle protein [Bacteroidaceae bacterium]MBR1755393.1 four helix bundle protein [Bacteroidaceae bacterium]
MVQNNVLAEKSIDFGVRMIKCYQFLCKEKKEYIISKQIYRSGTSIGANIHEGIYAQSKPDFLSKLGIALKEAGETSYWLRLLYRTEYIEENVFSSLYKDCEELIKILTATIKSSKDNA